MHDFSKKYSRNNFIKYLKDFLPNDLSLKEEEYKDETKTDLCKKIYKLGEVVSLDNLSILEIEHSSANDPRVSLTKKVFSIFKKLSINKALVIFYCKDSDNYRFSLIESSYTWQSDTVVSREFSLTKRLSFLLGPEAKIHTPHNQLKKRITNYNDLKKRFDIEVISDEFFDQYKNLYKNLHDSLKKDKNFIKFITHKKIKTYIFTKKLLGQIVFCYFLQKKGCLGAKKNQSLGSGNKNFLRDNFSSCISKKKNFYNDFLEYLFYDGLNTENINNYVESIQCKVPYLNGGLFEEIESYDWKNETLKLSNDIFSNNYGNGILDVFDLYNFTVDESDEFEIEIGIDPEMLGKVFEKLLPENFKKGKGSYYTHRPVVSFMCKQAIKNFLTARDGLENFENFIHDLVNFTYLEDKEIILIINNFNNKKTLYKIDECLKNLKICDPAIGSGAFPVQLMTEVVKIRKNILQSLNEKFSTYLLKRDFIENSIYGVDIDKGAVEIAKLRLWLSLIVEETNINNVNPLPNLSYKIVQGNSLIQRYKNYDFDEKDEKTNELFTDDQTDKIKHDLIEIQKKYFNLKSRKKRKELRKSLEEKINSLIIKKTQNNNKDDMFVNKTERNFFLWKIFFLDVFENGGFDIVIGNPPYVFSRSSELKKIAKEDKQYYKERYKLTQFQLNTYSLFLELGQKILNQSGSLSYIIPVNWMTINTDIDTRKFILEKSNIQIINYSERVFKKLGVDVAILNFDNDNKRKNQITIFSENETNQFEKIKTSIKDKINEDNDFIINFDLIKKPKLKEILFKINKNSKTLYPHYGKVKSGLGAYKKGFGIPKQTQKMIDDKVYHSDKKIDKNYIKYFEGDDIKRYLYEWSKSYLKYGKNLAEPRALNLFTTNRILVRQIPSSPPYCINACYIKEKFLNDRNSMNIIDLNINPLVALGIINSKLISFWFILRFAKLQRALFPQFKINELEKFPIPNIKNKTREKELASLVEKKLNNPNDNSIDNKIDEIIYDLFSISNEDKVVIEKYLNDFNN
tara:strand:+ start:3425 stop:6499 length:3075 start_codon:yes stop_codon:yes gene_type:complete